jgi:hypothetical protein
VIQLIKLGEVLKPLVEDYNTSDEDIAQDIEMVQTFNRQNEEYSNAQDNNMI